MKIVAGKALNHRKPTQAPTRQRAEQGEVARPRGDEQIADVGEADDRHAAGGQPVEAVGEVDRAGRARHHQVDDAPGRSRRRRSGRRSTCRRSESGRPAFWVATHHSQTEMAIVTISLVRAAQAQRAALDDLGVVVGEARAARRRSPCRTTPDRPPVVVRSCISTGTENAAKMMIPPIVGVPALTWWPSGPSSRMCWPNSRSRSDSMNRGDRNMQISSAAVPPMRTSPIRRSAPLRRPARPDPARGLDEDRVAGPPSARARPVGRLLRRRRCA